MNKISYGYASAISGALFWGMAPLFYRLLSDFPLIEVVAQRAFWSCFIFIIVFTIRNRLPEIRLALSSFKNISLFIICSALIGTNWLLFIFAIKYGQLMQSALGYYIFPLLTAAMGYYFFGERLEKLTKVALLFALAAALLKATTLSNFPWIAISMATTFAFYTIIRKQLPVKPDAGTMIETIMLAPIAVIYFGWQAQNGAILFFGGSLIGVMLSVFCGLFTIIPLYLFHNGNKVLPLAIAGLIFYLNPTSQLIISIMLGEPFNIIDIFVFVLIWTGLLIQFSPMIFKEQ